METALLHGKIVSIIESHGLLTRIIPTNGDMLDAFWVRSNNLKKMKTPKKHVEVASLVPLCSIPATTDYASFAPWLSSEDYRLKAHVRACNIEKAKAQYVEWSGEVLPDDCIVLCGRDVETTWAPFNEWILTFPFSKSVSYPFPIVSTGVGGGLSLGQPAGILCGKIVKVHFRAIIEPLVRAGLRAKN